MYKKVLLSSAIAVALGTSGFAQAAIDLNDADATTNSSLTYASEITVSASGTTLTDSATNVQDLTAELGFSVNSGSVRFVRVELSDGATFTAAPGLTVTDGTTPSTGTVSAGGVGQSFVIFEFTAGDDYAPDDTVTIDVTNVDVISQAAVTASYDLFETGTAAANSGTALASTSQVAYRFGSALDITVEDASEETIEVATNSTEFMGNVLVTPIAQIEIGTDGTTLSAASAPATLSDLVAAGTALEVSGDFTAVARDGNGDPDVTKVQLNDAGGNTLVSASTLTDTLATFVVDDKVFADTDEAIVTMTVTGDDEIIDGPFTGVYNVVAAANANTADQSLGELSNLEKNGSSVTANLVLTPTTDGGVYRNFLRVTNTSNIDGRVFVRVRNDVGDSATFALGNVTGQDTVLGGQESTS